MSTEHDPEPPATTVVERAAELDVGLVDGREAGAAALLARRAELAADPQHVAAVDALAATRAELASAPPVPMPAGAPGRWAALVDRLHEEEPAEPPAPVARLRPRPARPVLAAAAVLVVVATAVGVLLGRSDDRPEVSRVTLTSVAMAAQDVQDIGELTDPARRAACLAAVAPQVRPDAQLIAGRLIRYEGEPGVLLLLGTGVRGVFTVVVVDDPCGRLLVMRRVP